MRKTLAYARTSALPAIAAVLALSSTPLLAQQAQPVPPDAATTNAPPQQAPATDPAPAQPAASSDTTTQTTTASDSTTSILADTTSPAPAPKAIKHATHVAVAKPAKVMTQTVTRTAATQVTAPVAAKTTVAARTPAAAPPVAQQSAVTPVVDMNAKTAQASTTTTTSPAKKHNETVPIAAGGVLALLAIGGAAAAMNRRRHDDEEDWAADDAMAYEPVESAVAEEPARAPMVLEDQPAILAPSAFAWDGNSAASKEPQVEHERQQGETWVERAYRGPSPSNPSVSLKNRLRRAAFFDKRERDAAAGLAEPLDPTAGLPKAMVAEREAEIA